MSDRRIRHRHRAPHLYFPRTRAPFQRMPNAISIIIVEADRDRATQIVDSLRDAGDYDFHIIGENAGLARKI